MPQKTATVIGSTGLIGSHLVELLQQDESFGTIRALVRRPVSFAQPKVEMKLVDFSDSESVKLAIDGSDVVFCAVGTTQKKVKGDKAAYRKVDYDIPVNAARFCAEIKCPQFVVVSSVGASSQASNFYLKLKGEVEDKIKQYPIPSISIFRPSMLLGKRKEFRLGEKIGQGISGFFAFLLVGKWEKFRPVNALAVARAMIESSLDATNGVRIFEYEEIREKAAAYESHQKLTAGPHLAG